MAFTVKNEVLVRVYAVLAVIIVVAMAIVYRTVQISVVEGEKWREKGKSLYIKEVPVEAERGNILTENGNLLATSMPFFDIALDPNSSGMDSADWNLHLDSLAFCIATFVDPSFTPGGMREYLEEKKQEIKRYLQESRNAGKQYIMIKKDATIEEKELISSFPLFNLGRFKGGLIVQAKYKRERPFGLLANRSIGYVKGDSISVGLEGYFDEYLRGDEGTHMMYRVGNGMWIPLEDLAKIEPKPGQDIVTTLDMDIQGIAENALQKAMYKHKAEYGTAIVMEVKTGAIKAIANLDWKENGSLWENYNHAIGTLVEPGSTFKLASMLALLEDGLVGLHDSIDLEQGRTIYYDVQLEDATPHTLNNATIEQAFAMSSNVGVSRLVYNHYATTNNADKFIDRLKSFYLDVPTGIEINGEPNPYFKRAYSEEDDWSGTTLPWMSIGYEMATTPLQLLAFYNAVANEGIYVKPFIVTEVQQFGETVKRFPITEVKGRIASKKNIKSAQRLLRAVVDSTYGTAYQYRSDMFSFAGKTGTTQLGYQRLENKTKVRGYQASFAGYFPADDPVYSCIVLISKPKDGGYYGSAVALPIFKEIAEKTFRTNLELYPVVNDTPIADLDKKGMPDYDAGNVGDIKTVFKELDVKYFNRSDDDWAIIRATETDSLKLIKRPISQKQVPNVLGMGLRDALFLLENRGLEVQVNGNYGKVKQQSIKPGSKANGQTIWIRLG
ncbi:MAG: penicillin-binding protein [Saprospiraceae bacterium]